MELWASIDEQLCELVDRLRVTGHCHTLEVEQRLSQPEAYLNDGDFTEFLPRFREKGVVTVIGAINDNQVLHSSIRNH